jgi:hypothetical protein
MLAELRCREQRVNHAIESHWHPVELLSPTGARLTAVAMVHLAGVLPIAGDRCCEAGGRRC